MSDLFLQAHLLEADAKPIIEHARSVFCALATLPLQSRIYAINAIRESLHEHSPFRDEPVDCIRWIASEELTANDYNPNSVAPPEMKLLEHSITEDGYTQPIVAWKNGKAFEVVDGFHRNRVGRESKSVRERVHGYLPVTVINEKRIDRSDRIAATIRHNRARGKHKVEAMSDIVVELKRRNWSDEKIGRELGMDADEVLRLCQITGLADHLIEPQTWGRVVARVNGANSGALYIEEKGNVTGYNKISKPAGHTWKSFCQLLLATMPDVTREHYLARFRGWMKGWQARGYRDGIPDEAPRALEKKYWAPSWRRLCKVLLRNDWWCKGLGLTQPKSAAYERYLTIRREKRAAA